MKKTFLLEGLDCANCAAKIERAVSKIEGVTKVSVNFLTTKMIIEAEEEAMDEIVKKAKKVVRREEADVDMVKA
ncbi:MAG: cation transporter [Clostridium sp.]|nr:cation transporter [Clostridium sp.]